MSPVDPLAAIDARIAKFRVLRAAAPRFSEAYWEADDAISSLRAMRVEVTRWGRAVDEVLAFLDTPAMATMADPDGGVSAVGVGAVPAELLVVEMPAVVGAPVGGSGPALSAVPARRSDPRGQRETAEPISAA